MATLGVGFPYPAPHPQGAWSVVMGGIFLEIEGPPKGPYLYLTKIFDKIGHMVHVLTKA